VIATFADEGTAEVYHGRATRAARRTLPESLRSVAWRKLDMLNAAHDIGDLRVPPGNRLEKLVGSLARKWSIRINAQYRIVFTFEGSTASDVRITDYH
jgi:toxin HigB-1